MIHWRGFQ